MRIRSVLHSTALLITLLPGIVGAQSIGKMLETDFRNFGGDVWAVWTSPFRAGPRDWLATGAWIGASALVSPLDDNIDRWMIDHETSSGWSAIKELREGGAAFSGKYVTPVAAGLLVYGLAAKNTKIQEGIFGCLASYVSGSIVRNYVVYYVIGRERPDSSRDEAITSPPADSDDQYNFTFPGKKEWGMHSFPAGHAANILACSSFLSNRFEMGVFEPLLYAFSGGVAVGRLVDRRHWTSDTVIGLVFGYAIGKQVAHRSLNRASVAYGTKSAAASLLNNTYVTPSGKGLTVGWKTTF